jgi:hypothetical protein
MFYTCLASKGSVTRSKSGCCKKKSAKEPSDS